MCFQPDSSNIRRACRMLLSPLQAVQDKPVGLVSYVQQTLMNRLTMHVCPSCQSAPPLFEQNVFHQQVALIVDLQPGPIASQELRFTCQVTKEEGTHSLSSDRFRNPPVHKWETWGLNHSKQSCSATLWCIRGFKQVPLGSTTANVASHQGWRPPLPSQSRITNQHMCRIRDHHVACWRTRRHTL